MHSAKAAAQSSLRRTSHSFDRYLDYPADGLSLLDWRAGGLRNGAGRIVWPFLLAGFGLRAAKNSLASARATDAGSRHGAACLLDLAESVPRLAQLFQPARIAAGR